jgi:hypothetical protein
VREVQNVILGSLLVFCITLPFIFSQQEYSAEDAPGELSLAHSVNPGIKSCMKCHNEDFEVPVQGCLACHPEIAQRISAKKGYHQDKGEECAVCHSEHQGKDFKLFELDTEDFDHTETGYKLEGAHSHVSECRSCHSKENTHPRKTALSYLMKKSGCPSCHKPPHPGRQEICLSCHTQDNWIVDIWDSEEAR